MSRLVTTPNGETFANFGSAPGPFLTRRLDAFALGYLEALAFTDQSSPGDDEAYGLELSEEALSACLDDCERFQAHARELLELAYAQDYDEAQAGRDLWFTRNGHGVGYWERKALEVDLGRPDIPERLWRPILDNPTGIDRLTIGNALSALCGWQTNWPEVSVYRGDDQEAHLA